MFPTREGRMRNISNFDDQNTIIVPGKYSVVTSGTSCEETGSAKITTLEECRSALQSAGFGHRVKGTDDLSDQPMGCYLRSDGNVWFNQPALCTSQLKCDVCEIGKELQGSAKLPFPFSTPGDGNLANLCTRCLEYN